jgi:hypothetical protein
MEGLKVKLTYPDYAHLCANLWLTQDEGMLKPYSLGITTWLTLAVPFGGVA